MDPPRYRRTKYFDRRALPNTYYRLRVLEEIHTTLFAKGGSELVQRFRGGPFGHLLDWNPSESHGQVLHSILTRSIYKNPGMWFHIGGQDIEYTIQDHALVTGLMFGESGFNPTIGRDPMNSALYRAVRGWEANSSKLLINHFAQLQHKIQDPNGEIHLRLAHVLMADTFILGHDAQKSVFHWLWILADDFPAFCKFPWGAYSFKTLRYYVRRTTENKHYHAYGPMWALLVWGFEVVPGLGNAIGRALRPDAIPRCLRWGFISHREDITDEDIYGLFDQEGYFVSNLQPEPAECRTPYFGSLLQLSPLGVSFTGPKNPFKSRDAMPSQAQHRRHASPPPVDVTDASGSRARRSTARPVDYTEPPDEIGSSSRPPRRRRDPVKRATQQARDDSSSSSGGPAGGPSPSVADRVLLGIREEIGAYETRMNAHLEAVEERMTNRIKGVEEDMGKIKKWVKKIMQAVGCGSSHSSPRVVSPRRRSPPTPFSARDSAMDPPVSLAGPSISEPALTHVEDVGMHRDTSLPVVAL